MQHIPANASETNTVDLAATDAQLQAELDTLRRRLAALEEDRLRSHRKGGRSLRNVVAMLIAMVVLMVLANAPLVHGQSVVDALFISAEGNVGIGTTDPASKLDVNGALAAGGAAAGNHFLMENDEIQQYNGTTPADMYLNKNGGNVVIKGGDLNTANINASGALDIQGALNAGGGAAGNHFFMKDYVIQQYNGTTPSAMYLNPAGGNVFVGGALSAATMNATNITASSINGEKPPMVFDVGMNTDTTMHYTSGPIDIGPLCGDADGCTMKFLFRVKSTDEVRVITEQIYIEQPGNSGNKTAGLHGWAFQLGNAIDWSFVLNTAVKYDVVPYPWNWIYVRNYQQIVDGVVTSGPVLPGYNVTFRTVPNIAATVIIYDR